MSKRKTKKKCSLKEKGCQDMDWIHMACNKEHVSNIPVIIIRRREIFHSAR
jgi:hypothetical protein